MLDLLHIGTLVLIQQTGQKMMNYLSIGFTKLPVSCHNEARAAESTLTSTEFCQPGLERMKAILLVSQRLHSGDLPAITGQNRDKALGIIRW